MTYPHAASQILETKGFHVAEWAWRLKQQGELKLPRKLPRVVVHKSNIKKRKLSWGRIDYSE